MSSLILPVNSHTQYLCITIKSVRYHQTNTFILSFYVFHILLISIVLKAEQAVRLWNILENTWFDRLEEEVLAEDFRKHGLSTAHKEVR